MQNKLVVAIPLFLGTIVCLLALIFIPFVILGILMPAGSLAQPIFLLTVTIFLGILGIRLIRLSLRIRKNMPGKVMVSTGDKILMMIAILPAIYLFFFLAGFFTR